MYFKHKYIDLCLYLLVMYKPVVFCNDLRKFFLNSFFKGIDGRCLQLQRW